MIMDIELTPPHLPDAGFYGLLPYGLRVAGLHGAVEQVQEPNRVILILVYSDDAGPKWKVAPGEFAADRPWLPKTLVLWRRKDEGFHEHVTLSEVNRVNIRALVAYIRRHERAWGEIDRVEPE